MAELTNLADGQVTFAGTGANPGITATGTVSSGGTILQLVIDDVGYTLYLHEGPPKLYESVEPPSPKLTIGVLDDNTGASAQGNSVGTVVWSQP